MTAFKYRRVRNPQTGLETVTAFNNGLVEVKSIHPSFNAIVAGLDAGDPGVWELFDVAGGIMRRFRKITPRISFDGSNILFDGDVVHSTLSNQVMRALESGTQDYEAIAKFWEKLESNPNAHSRAQTYDFLASHAFQITQDGNVVAFKGVRATSDGGYESVRRSEAPGIPSAYVDGVAVPPLSNVPNNIGTTVSMPRSEVIHDPDRHCTRGLHVSTRSYAGTWGVNGAVVEVHVHPMNFVSVPNDARGEKVRVCEYDVVRVAVEPGVYSTPVLSASTNTWVGDVGYQV